MNDPAPFDACIYHGGCPDGFAAYMAVREHNRGLGAEPPEPVPAAWGDPLPDIPAESRVAVVDFNYPPEQLIPWIELSGHEVVVMDHHDTSMRQWWERERSRGIEGEMPDRFDVAWIVGDDPEGVGSLAMRLDANRSGAGIAWDELHGARPALVNYVENRDLWRNDMNNWREMSALILAIPFNVEAWDAALFCTDLEQMVEQGKGALAFQTKLIEEACLRSQLVTIGGRTMPMTNCQYTIGSTTADALMDRWDYDLAGYWLETPAGEWQYGFRSRNGVTVNDLAEQLGGGGHKQAAGCRSPKQLHRRMPT